LTPAGTAREHCEVVDWIVTPLLRFVAFQDLTPLLQE